MTCTLPRPTPQDLYNRISAAFSTTVLGGANIIPESVEWYVVANDYAMAEEFHSIAAQQWRERDPRYACCDNLVVMAARDGVYPKPAGFAQGYVKLTGVAGSVLTTPITLNFGSLAFKSTGTVPATMPASGDVIIQIKAVVPGSAGNAVSGFGTLTSPIAGVNTRVTATGNNFCGGAAAEECETFRARYLARLAYQPRATDAWIKAKIMEWPCVTRVAERGGTCLDGDGDDCGCSCNACQGRLEFYALFDGSFDCGLAPQSVIDDINVWLFGTPTGLGKGQVEIGVCGKVYAATGTKINLLLYGLSCLTPAQSNEVLDVIKDVFSRISPSAVLQRRTIELAIAQIVGPDKEFYIEFTVAGGHGHISGCGDVVPDCDYMPCIGTINFAPASATFGGCA